MNVNGIVTDLCTAFSFCFIFWVVFTTITGHMTARSHNGMQEKVFDKLNATPALSELVSSGALAPFLQSLTPEKPTPAAPLPRILRGVWVGIVLIFFGIAMLFLHHHTVDSGSGFLITGTGAIGLGLGFLTAALASIWLSRQLGLLGNEPRA